MTFFQAQLSTKGMFTLYSFPAKKYAMEFRDERIFQKFGSAGSTTFGKKFGSDRISLLRIQIYPIA